MNMVWYVWLPLLGLIATLGAVEIIVRRRYRRARKLVDAFSFRKAAEKRRASQRGKIRASEPGRAAEGEWAAQRPQ